MYEDIKMVLHKFNEGYIHRDVEKLDDYMAELFVNSPDTIVLGTSNGELCLGFEAVKQLVKMDWLHWGDFRLNVESTLFQEGKDAVWFVSESTLGIKFKYNDESLERQVGFFKEDLKAASEHPLQGLTLANWLLRHVLAAREEGERLCVYPLRLTGAMVRESGTWKFSYMQFSVPSPTFPDERVGNDFLDKWHPVKPFAVESVPQSSIRPVLITQIQKLAESISLGDTANPLGWGANPYVIDPRGELHSGTEQIEKCLTSIREEWGQMALDLDNAVAITKGDLSWVVSAGTMSKCAKSDEVLKQRLEASLAVLDLGLPAKEKLFLVSRDIAHTLKEVSHGTSYKWPCRVEAVFSRSGEAWVLNNMQLSFPYYWILEGKL